MERQPRHLSDVELVMAADGELPARDASRVGAHLQACWACRERLRSQEETIAHFVRAHNGELRDQVPPIEGPRAILRARLGKERDRRGTPGSWAHTFLRHAWTVAACLCVLAVALVFLDRTVSAEGSRPDLRITPGETRPIALAEVCRNAAAEVIVRNISDEMRRQVFRTYGIQVERAADFEVDYLITPDLGGTESVRNLWPQPYSHRWNAKTKDKLEQRLHELVCAGQMDLPTAQREIAADWIRAYRKYVGSDGFR